MSEKHLKRSSNTGQVRGRADWQRLRNMTEEEIERTSPPELANLPEDFWKDAKVVYPNGKTPISLRVDQDVLTWFRESGPRYQTHMNAVLRAYVTRMKNQAAGSGRTRRKKEHA